MQYYKKILIDMICWLKTLFSDPDYYISRFYIEYNIELSSNSVTSEPDVVWDDQARDWTSDGAFHWDITRDYRTHGSAYVQRILDTIPAQVTDLRYVVRYSYNDRVYKFVSRDDLFEWPPDIEKGMRFHFPIVEAWACDSKDHLIRDVTNSLKKVAGPRGDFHKQDGVRVKDVVKYDLPQLRVTTLMGHKMYVEDDDLLRII